MTDDEFLLAVTEGRLAPADFNHAAHIRLACLYLADRPFLEACIAMRDSLQAFAARIGRVGLYHETITIAFMSLVAERRARCPGLGPQALLAANPDLSARDLLNRYYDPDVLASNAARVGFLLPLPQAGAVRA